MTEGCLVSRSWRSGHVAGAVALTAVREALDETMRRRLRPGVDPSMTSPARMYDRYLGGTANFQADRDAVDRILELVPEIRDAAWANRGFLQRAVRWMAERDIRQFIDLGAGLPTQRCTHEVAREIRPGCPGRCTPTSTRA